MIYLIKKKGKKEKKSHRYIYIERERDFLF